MKPLRHAARWAACVFALGMLLILPGGNHFVTAAAFYDPDRAPEVLPAVLRFVGAGNAEVRETGTK